MISLGAHSLLSFSTMAKPPTAYSSPPQLTRLTELLSWGNSVKGDHLQQGALSCINLISVMSSFLPSGLSKTQQEFLDFLSSLLIKSSGSPQRVSSPLVVVCKINLSGNKRQLKVRRRYVRFFGWLQLRW